MRPKKRGDVDGVEGSASAAARSITLAPTPPTAPRAAAPAAPAPIRPRNCRRVTPLRGVEVCRLLFIGSPLPPWEKSVVVLLVHGLPEFPVRSPQRSRQRGKLRGSEQHQDDRQDDEELSWSQVHGRSVV